MGKLFFKDIRGNLFSTEGIWGFVVDTVGDEVHYLILVKETSVEVTKELYTQMTANLLIMEAEAPATIVIPEEAE